jgi:hypothetical protein
MKFKFLFIVLIISNNFYSQSKDVIFDSECWKSTIKNIGKSTVVFAIQNAFDNRDKREDTKKHIVIYYQDSLFNWWIKVVLVDLKKKKWMEIEPVEVNLYFEKYIDSNLINIKKDFEEMYNDRRRTWGSDISVTMRFFYHDASFEMINNCYSLTTDGINSLFDSYPRIFTLYSHAMNSSYNMKFNRRMTKKIR